MFILFFCLLLGPTQSHTLGTSTPASPRKSCRAENLRIEKLWREQEIVAYPSSPLLALPKQIACGLGPSLSWVRLLRAFLSRKPPHQPVQLQSGVVNGVSSVAADALVVVADPLR